MEKKKIAIIQPVIPRIGGNEKVLANLIKALKGHDLTLYSLTKPQNDYGVKTKMLIPFKFPLLGIYQKLLMPEVNLKNYDFFVSCSHAISSKTPGIIYDQNNLGIEKQNYSKKYESGFWKLYYNIYAFFEQFKKIDRNMDYYSISVYCAKKLQKKLGKKINVLYPPVDLSEFRHEEKENKICVVGRISPEKNLENTITILNEIPCECVIFGSVDAPNLHYLNQLKSLAKSHIEFKINCPRDQLIDLLAKSKIIFTTSRETLGIAIVEGIQSRCIPIVPDHTAHPETVPFQILRFNHLDHESIVKKLNLALEGEFDCYLPELLNANSKFDFKTFQNKLNSLLEHGKIRNV